MKQRNTILCIATLALSLLGGICHADFELGVNYYEAGEFEQAYKEFYQAAQYGDHDAQLNLGAMYYRGEYQPKNPIKAYAWMALAAQNPSINEDALHTKILAKLSATQQTEAKAEYQALLAEYGNAAVEKKLMPVFSGASLAVKSQRSIKRVPPTYPHSMLQQGATGFVDMTYTIDKHGLTRDHVTTYAASKAFEKAAIDALRQFQFEPVTVNGKAVAVNGLRMRFNFGMQDTRYNKDKLDKELSELRKKAQSGSSNDKLSFAYFLDLVPSFASDYALSDNPNEWYTQAALQGNNAASYFLGRNILYGNMCTQDNNQSMGWLLKAAKAGISDAQYMLAIESFSGANFEKNEDKGFYWLERAASANAHAKLRHAWLLATYPDAARRNGKLAQQQLATVDKEHLDVQSYLQTQAAVAAENGDFKQAVKWQKQALKDAKKMQLPNQYLQQQLANYSAKQPWREEI